MPAATSAAWFKRDADPDRKPNIFSRMGKGVSNSVTGLFRKKEPIEVLPTEEVGSGWVTYPPKSQPRSIEPVQSQPVSQPVFAKPVKTPKKAKLEMTPQAYLQDIQQQILSQATLPQEAKGMKLSETVRVYFVLNATGVLGKVFIPEEHRSEYGFLNEAAITTVHEASRSFKPFPSSMDPSEKLLSIEIKFQD